MASYHGHPSSETDSMASTPRSEHLHPVPFQEANVRFMVSFGGRILPRPQDNQLRYVGGETRIVSVDRSMSFAALQSKLSKLSNTPDVTLKYQLPSEDLDALISVTTDEDLDNMMDEYDRIKSSRLRLFLFPPSDVSASAFSLLLDGSSKQRESWFLDALNGRHLERGRSEVSSTISDVPDYLSGFDPSEDPKPKSLSSRLLPSDPGSPAAPPPASSPFVSAASTIPDLPFLKTKPDPPPPEPPAPADSTPLPPAQPAGFAPIPLWHYVQDSAHLQGSSVQPMPVYYVPAGNIPMPVHPQPYGHRVSSPALAPPPMAAGQIPAGSAHQMYGAGVTVMRPREGYEFPSAVAHTQPQMYYAAPQPGNGGAYPMAGEAQLQGPAAPEVKMGRVPQSH